MILKKKKKRLKNNRKEIDEDTRKAKINKESNDKKVKKLEDDINEKEKEIRRYKKEIEENNKRSNKLISNKDTTINDLKQQIKTEKDKQEKSKETERIKKLSYEEDLNKRLTSRIEDNLSKSVFKTSNPTYKHSKIKESNSSYTISGDFKICETPIDFWSQPTIIKTGCDLKEVEYEEIIPAGSVLKNIHILSEISYQVKGKINICSLYYVEITTYKNFFGVETKTEKIKESVVNYIECASMIESKECRGHKLICEHNQCIYDGSPVVEYSYLRERTLIGHICKIKSKLINVKDKETNLFNTNCKVKDLSCQLGKEMAIWSKNIINLCPYQYISSLSSIEVARNNIWTDFYQHLFKVVERFNLCNNITAFRTTEGLILSLDKRVLKFNYSDIELSAIHKLMLVEEDAAAERAHERIKEVNRQNCFQQEEILNLMRLQENRFYNLHSKQNKEMIVYANKGILQVPRCIKIDEINLNKAQNSNCSNRLEISFNLDNIKMKGYLTNDRIIRLSKDEKKCSRTHILSLNGIEIIVKKSKNLEIKKLTNTISTSELSNLEESDRNFLHDKKILSRSDLLKEFEMSNYQDIMSNDIKEEIIGNESTENFILPDILTKAKEFTKSYIIHLMYLAIIAISLIIITAIAYWRYKKAMQNYRDMNGKVFERLGTAMFH